MKIEVVELPSHLSHKGGLSRKWEIRNEHGNVVGTTEDLEFVRYLEDAETVNSYKEECARTESLPIYGDFPDALLRTMHAAMGLATEAGEFMDMVKKCVYYGDTLDLDNLDEEAGDSLWYIAEYLNVRGKSFAEIMAANVRKLQARYPKRFAKEKALRRDLEQEQKAMKEKEE